jgi:uncharacterized protein (DUF3820 family)
MTDIRMPFGKYKGWKLSYIGDEHYLRWIFQNIDESPRNEQLLSAVKERLEQITKRPPKYCHPGQQPTSIKARSRNSTGKFRR